MKPIYLQRIGGHTPDGKIHWSPWAVIDFETIQKTVQWTKDREAEGYVPGKVGKYELLIADEADGYFGGSYLYDDGTERKTFIFNEGHNDCADTIPADSVVRIQLNENQSADRSSATMWMEKRNGEV